MIGTKESEIEKILVEEVRKAGGRAPKWVSPGNVGVPDRIVFLPGRTQPLFIELKADTGRLSGPQKVWAAWLRNMQQHVRTVYGMRGLEELFRELGMTDSARRVRQTAERKGEPYRSPSEKEGGDGK